MAKDKGQPTEAGTRGQGKARPGFCVMADQSAAGRAALRAVGGTIPGLMREQLEDFIDSEYKFFLVGYGETHRGYDYYVADFHTSFEAMRTIASNPGMACEGSQITVRTEYASRLLTLCIEQARRRSTGKCAPLPASEGWTTSLPKGRLNVVVTLGENPDLRSVLKTGKLAKVMDDESGAMEPTGREGPGEELVAMVETSLLPLLCSRKASGRERIDSMRRRLAGISLWLVGRMGDAAIRDVRDEVAALLEAGETPTLACLITQRRGFECRVSQYRVPLVSPMLEAHHLRGSIPLFR